MQFVLILALVLSQGPSPAPPKPSDVPKEQGADNKAKPSPSSTIAGAGTASSTLGSAPVANSEPRNNADNNDKEPAADWWSRILALLTVFVLAFQALLMFRQTEWMGVTTRIAAAVERSHLHPDNLGVLNFYVGQQPTIFFKILNDGRNPAQTIETLVKYSIGLDLPSEPNYEGGKTADPAVVRAQSSIDSPVDLDEVLTNEQYTKVVRGEWSLFVWGKITYRDEFQAKAVTGFGNRLVRQSDGTFAPEIFGGLAYNYFGVASEPKNKS